MLKELDSVFAPFVERGAASVMARAALQRLITPTWRETIFERTRERQYTRELLFSAALGMMVRLVLGQAKSVRAAYLTQDGKPATSLAAVYEQLGAVSINTSAALVRESAAAVLPLIAEMGG